METKLTLKLDKDVILQAKNFARDKDTSLSKMVENYFRSLVLEKKEHKKSKLVSELSGIINLDSSTNMRDDYTNYLTEKYK